MEGKGSFVKYRLEHRGCYLTAYVASKKHGGDPDKIPDRRVWDCIVVAAVFLKQLTRQYFKFRSFNASEMQACAIRLCELGVLHTTVGAWLSNRPVHVARARPMLGDALVVHTYVSGFIKQA